MTENGQIRWLYSLIPDGRNFAYIFKRIALFGSIFSDGTGDTGNGLEYTTLVPELMMTQFTGAYEHYQSQMI